MNIRKVAEMAGVSVATISRVLNHPEQVLPETREHVLSMMKQLNYTPNFFARSLNLSKTNTIALLIPSIESDFYQKVISGIETVVRSKDYAVFFCNTHGNPQIEFDFIKMVAARRIDGIVLVSSHLDEQQALHLQNTKIPSIHIGKNRISGCETLCYIDFEEGTYRLIRHLIGLGHQRIDLLLDNLQTNETAQIEAGFRRAQRESGKRIKCKQSFGESSVQGGYIAGQRMVQQDDFPDALVTASDEQALGVMKAAQDTGLLIPQQLALASMTDSPMCSIVSPPLTCLEHPAVKLGMAAARLLLDNIENKELELGVPQEMILQPKLKIRKSCGNTKYIYELFD
ncbi:MAG: LacI family DNA-binding transcriptional regulator [Clostridia bacterium]